MAEHVPALVVGGGPAGLIAADVLGAAGVDVVLTEAMPTVGRKFLMAGKSGLNLTRAEPFDRFLARYGDGAPAFTNAVRSFGPEAVEAWVTDLGEPTFTGSTGRVFPTAMKASPLLRRWLVRLDSQGVNRRTRWRWTGWDGDVWLFDTPDGTQQINSDAAVLALGGGSWRRLGSDGAWQIIFAEAGIPCRDFLPSNVGLSIDWSPHMEPHFGSPVKGVALTAGGTRSRGEWVVTRDGIEGGGVYDVSREVRDGAALRLDLKPGLSEREISNRLSRPRSKASLGTHLRKRLGLDGALRALLMEWGRPLPEDTADLARLIKTLPVPEAGPLPLDQAISTAGGVDWHALDGFELKACRGTFCAGEMLDWDAPTGGYLLTGCLATGKAAAEAALAHLKG